MLDVFAMGARHVVDEVRTRIEASMKLKAEESENKMKVEGDSKMEGV